MKRSTYITLGIYLAALIVVWLGVWPFWQDVQSSRSAIDSLQSQIAYEQDAIERLAEIEQTIATSTERIEKIEQAIPGSRDAATLVAIFEEAATSNGLSLLDIAVANPAENQNNRQNQESSSVLDSFSLTLELSGRYGAFTSFLDDIETSFPVLDVSTVSFSIPQRSGSQEDSETRFQNPTLEFTVEMQTYYNEN